MHKIIYLSESVPASFSAYALPIFWLKILNVRGSAHNQEGLYIPSLNKALDKSPTPVPLECDL